MVKDIILAQKMELEKKLREKYIQREVNSSKLSSDLIKVIIGPRRAGKSFFAIHFLAKDFGYVNFDDERLVETKNYDEIIAALNSLYNNPKIVLFDEIQNLPRWELFVNRLQRQNMNLFITGSSSKMLSKELATHLTGRHFLIHIFPFSFSEYLEAIKQESGRELMEVEVKEKLSDYIKFGGYPEPLIKKIDYKDYLSTLFNSIVYKDIVKRYNIRASKEIDDLAFYLLSNISSEYSFNSLAKITNIKSVHTIQKYLNYLDEAFLFFSLGRFSYKVKEQISSNKKIYCFDNGFIYSKAFTASQNIGKLFENVVAHELKKKEMNNEVSVYYWKNPQQEEVDFVIKQGIKVTQLIQVCYDVEHEKTKNREIRALLKASEEFKCNDLMIITRDYESEEEREWYGAKGRVKFMPLYKWLGENNIE